MTDPAETAHQGTRVDGVRVLGALSPSRAADFKSCPLLYRYRTIDKLPEPPSMPAVRGTVVHKVLEDLFDLPAAERTPQRADAMVPAAWEAVVAERPESAEIAEATDPDAWFESCRTVLRRYFDLEDPRRLEPAAREHYVETLLETGLLLRGVVDRIDIAADGAIRVVDYKTGRSGPEQYEATALFQMRFYALVLWRTRGVVPAVLRLIYLGNSETLSYHPDEEDLLATERQVTALWDAVARAHSTGDWQPNRGRGCTWCTFQAHCPEYGGSLLPLPVRVEEQVGEPVRTDPGERLDEYAALPLEHRDVVRDDQDGAPGGHG